MAFKMKGSPMKRNFGIGASPAKFKLKYPKEEYTKRGFDPNMFSVRDGKVIREGKYVMSFRHDPNDPASVNSNRAPYDNYLKKLASTEAKIARSMEKAKARDEEVSPAKMKKRPTKPISGAKALELMREKKKNKQKTGKNINKKSPAKLKLDYKSMTKKQVRDAVVKHNRKGPKTSISMNHAMKMWNKAQERKGKDLEKFSDLEKFDDDRG